MMMNLQTIVRWVEDVGTHPGLRPLPADDLVLPDEASMDSIRRDVGRHGPLWIRFVRPTLDARALYRAALSRYILAGIKHGENPCEDHWHEARGFAVSAGLSKARIEAEMHAAALYCQFIRAHQGAWGRMAIVESLDDASLEVSAGRHWRQSECARIVLTLRRAGVLPSPEKRASARVGAA